LLGLFFDPDDGGDVPQKQWLIFREVRGVMPQKIELLKTFIVLSQTHIVK
jgi:hypothetical protein